MKILDPTTDMKTCSQISFEMLSSNLGLDSSDLGYLRYHDFKIDQNPLIMFSFHRSQARFVDREPLLSIER